MDKAKYDRVSKAKLIRVFKANLKGYARIAVNASCMFKLSVTAIEQGVNTFTIALLVGKLEWLLSRHTHFLQIAIALNISMFTH
jgi:hypothetical protein